MRKRPAAGDPQDEPERQRRRMQDADRHTARQVHGRVAARRPHAVLQQLSQIGYFSAQQLCTPFKGVLV